MRLVDAHCHLESEEFAGRLDGVIEDARRAGLVKLITCSIAPEQWPVSKDLARRYPEVEFAWGVHPWYIREEFRDRLDELRDARNQGAVAIGEIGLDRKIQTPAFEVQREFFETQLRIANEIDLPVILHCRGAFDALLAILKTVGAPARGGILHNFSGSAELARQCAGYGLEVSLGGTLTYRNSKKKIEVLEASFPDHLTLETDSPDIPPVEAREKPNVPANILHNLRAAAELLGESEETVAECTTRNAARVFGLEIG